MIHIAICDDNALHLAETSRIIEQSAKAHGELVGLTAFSSAESLLQLLQRGKLSMEIAILDIAMQEMDGIALAKEINALAPRCQIIFITGYLGFMMDVYEVEHVYCVLKGMLCDRIWPAIEKAHARYLNCANDYCAIQTTDGVLVLRHSDIHYFERCDRKTRIVTNRTEQWCKQTIQQLSAMNLPKQFIQCHQSFILNLDYVSSVEADLFILRDGTQIPISRARRTDARSHFWNYMNAAILQS